MAVKTDFRKAAIDAPTRAMLEFAEKATLHPHEMTPADLSALRQHGFCDEDILDITHVMAYFNYINRVADSLGVDGEDGFEPLELIAPKRARVLAEAHKKA